MLKKNFIFLIVEKPPFFKPFSTPLSHPKRNHNS